MTRFHEEPTTRERILSEAGRLIRDSGLHGLSMRTLAARLDMSATALYRHFDDKGALVLALSTEGFEQFGAQLFATLSEKSSTQRLHATVLRYVAFALKNPNHYRVMFMLSPQELSGLGLLDENRSRFEATLLFMADRVADGVRDGGLSPVDPLGGAYALLASLHGVMSLRLDEKLADLDETAFTDLARQTVLATLRGLEK